MNVPDLKNDSEVQLSSYPTAEVTDSIAAINEVEVGVNAEDVPEVMTAPTTVDASQNNIDEAAVEGAQVLQADRKDVEFFFGYAGFELSNALSECDSKHQFTPAQVRRYATLKNPLLTKATDKKTILAIHTAMKECNLALEPLKSGARSLGEKYEWGFHWMTALHAPWNYEQLYSLPGFIAGAVDTPLQVQFGEASERFDKKLTHFSDGDRELFAENLAKIVVIFLSESGVGPIDPKDSAKQGKKADEAKKAALKYKRDGMLHGLLCHKSTKQNIQYPVPIQKGAKVARLKLWGKVFEKNPIDVLDKKVIKCCEEYLKKTKNDTMQTDPHFLTHCLKEVATELECDWVDLLRPLTSTMTVADWVTTPWHLEHLPYTQQYAVFKDNECYSEGCKRCSRRFYEYPYFMYADGVGDTKGYTSWTNDMWRRTDNKVSNFRLAPVPIHDPMFWGGSYADMKPAKVAGIMEDLQQVADPDGRTSPTHEGNHPKSRGFWHHYALNLEKLNEDDIQSRKLKGKQSFQPYFRRSMNGAYQNDFADSDESYGNNNNGFYNGITQGYMLTGARRKLRYGDTDTRLTRSHKYGNTCRDCALVIEKTGLFVHNNRHVYEGAIVFGDKAAITNNVSWWEWMGKQDNSQNIHDSLAFLNSKENAQHAKYLQMKEQMEKDNPEGFVEDYEKTAKKQLDILTQHIKSKNIVNHENLTKIVSAPTLHMQKSIIRPESDKRLLDQAFDELEQFITTGNHEVVDIKNPALRDILFDMKAKHTFNKQFEVVDATRQFDSNFYRVEYRNCHVRQDAKGDLFWMNREAQTKKEPLLFALGENRSYGKLTAANLKKDRAHKQTTDWMNCLITDQLMGMNKPSQAAADSQLFTNKAIFKVEVFLVTRMGKAGDTEGPYPTQWRGDRYVTKQPEGEDVDVAKQHWLPAPQLTGGVTNRVSTQQRGYHQSRIFITYSLHRPVSGEIEGRRILEKMRLACLKIFGEDKYLAHMLQFGYMLSVNANADRVSKGTWKVIDKTKKADQMDTFYGGGKDSSYLSDTFETHVEKVEVDGGIEIGPKMHHPHFHIMLTLSHFSYVQFDYFKMNDLLGLMFKGMENTMFKGLNGRDKAGELMYKLVDAGGGAFYGDNENPYVDIKLYAQDDWKEVIYRYVRKGEVPERLEAIQGAYQAPPPQPVQSTTSNT